MEIEIKEKPTLDAQTDEVLIETEVVDSTPEILAPFTNNILKVIEENADIEINDNIKNFINETAQAFLDESFTTGLNRLSAKKEDGSYVYFDKLPLWVEQAQNHKDVTKLDNDQQTALFLANLHQQNGTNVLFKKISEGDMQAKVDMYIKHHHKGTIENGERIYNPKVIKYAEDIFFGSAGDKLSYGG